MFATKIQAIQAANPALDYCEQGDGTVLTPSGFAEVDLFHRTNSLGSGTSAHNHKAARDGTRLSRSCLTNGRFRSYFGRPAIGGKVPYYTGPKPLESGGGVRADDGE